MDHAEQKSEFEKITARAKRAGLLKANYPEHGIAILVVPVAPPPSEPAPATTPPPSGV